MDFSRILTTLARRGVDFVLIGGGRFDLLSNQSMELDAVGVTFRCVTLTKLIELKRAAGRPKDLEAIAELEALLGDAD